MSKLTEWLDRRLYPGITSNWDDDLLREAILSRLRPEMHVLDLGAGRGALPQMNFRGLARRVVGIDPDPRVLENPHLDEGFVGSGVALPFRGAEFDMVICDNVLEHIEEPEAVLAEIGRVLKAGGWFLAKTPNRNHYMPLVSALTPIRFHRYVNRLRGRKETDTFPTHYRINTPPAVARIARGAALEVRSIRLIERRPEYLRMSAPTYLFGAIYERVVNSVELFSRFRVLMLIELSKPVA